MGNEEELCVVPKDETALRELQAGLPAGVAAPKVLFRQADFIDASIGNVKEALRDGAIMVAIVLFAFLLSARTTLISLTAIPLSLAVTALVFQLLGQSINVMTLGGIAIAIGELVDDAVVDVENILRRLKQNRAAGNPLFEGATALREAVEDAAAEGGGKRDLGVEKAVLDSLLVGVPSSPMPSPSATTPGEQGRSAGAGETMLAAARSSLGETRFFDVSVTALRAALKTLLTDDGVVDELNQGGEVVAQTRMLEVAHAAVDAVIEAAA